MVVFFFFLYSQLGLSGIPGCACLWETLGEGGLGEESDRTTCILRGPQSLEAAPSLQPVASNSGHCPGRSLSCARRGGSQQPGLLQPWLPVSAVTLSPPCPPCRYFQNVSVGTLCCLHPGQWLTSGSTRREPKGRGAAQPWHVGAPITAHEVHRPQADVNCL